ncbi:MAG: ferrous iron transport protein A [Haliscomenobacter sp.]|nr:ferrous iron transport protein A [Haliscomenobacter sp.]
MAAVQNSGKPLFKVGVGDTGFVSHFTNDRIAGKLMAMGILPGCAIKVVRRAPFGGGCYIKADNILLALRKDEACTILVR